MSTFTYDYPIKTEASETNQKHLILSDTTVQGAQVNPAVEYVENYTSIHSKSISGSNIEMHNNVIYYPKIYTSTLALAVNNYFDDSSNKYINPYTEYYIVNPNEYYCRKLNMSNSNNYQEVTIDLRSNEVQTQIGNNPSRGELLRDIADPTYFAMIAAVFNPNESGEQIRLTTSQNIIFTDLVGNNNNYYEFLPGDNKYVDIMHIGLYPDDENHYYKFYYRNTDSNSINVIKQESAELEK